MPVLDLGLALAPAKKYMSAGHFAREVHQAEAAILELDAECLELSLISVDLACQDLRFALELFSAFARFVGTGGRRDQVELEYRLTPATVLLDNVLDDLPDQGEGPVGLLHRKKLHT
ncbi:MAG TPA: hypothetical protein VK636_17165 [Gemmatimonadaceae bacterium]|nr:hypothetical protein [Gemmatimonadaceae bacterium]